MLKTSKWLMIISGVFAILPILSILLTIVAAALFGCSVNETAPRSCPTPLGDWGEMLYLLGVFGWLIFISIPVGIAGILLGLALYIFARLKNT